MEAFDLTQSHTKLNETTTKKRKQIYLVACPRLLLQFQAYFKNKQRKMDIQTDPLVYKEKQNSTYWVA